MTFSSVRSRWWIMTPVRRCKWMAICWTIRWESNEILTLWVVGLLKENLLKEVVTNSIASFSMCFQRQDSLLKSAANASFTRYITTKDTYTVFPFLSKTDNFISPVYTPRFITFFVLKIGKVQWIPYVLIALTGLRNTDSITPCIGCTTKHAQKQHKPAVSRKIKILAP